MTKNLSRGSLVGPSGFATIGGSVAYVALSPDAVARPHVAVGLSAAFLTADGSAFPPFVAGSGMVVAPFVWAGTGTSVRLASHLHMRGDIALGTTTSAMRLDFAGRSEGTWGRPALAASLGFEFGLFVPPW